ncbi:hypothetical protein CASFOL_021606 [Castilleja foliolosa]|uniref:Uncharacterized protein n=1 Tax=Castilleja foliolosa TaxID=1961234 RepID=A0ABD3CYK5_9LAMI
MLTVDEGTIYRTHVPHVEQAQPTIWEKNVGLKFKMP